MAARQIFTQRTDGGVLSIEKGVQREWHTKQQAKDNACMNA